MKFSHQPSTDDQNQTKELAKFGALSRFSERHFRRLIKRQTGKTPGQLFRRERLRVAKTLLTTTTLSITDIVFRSGFSSVRQFNTAFRQLYSKSPREFRQSLLASTGA